MPSANRWRCRPPTWPDGSRSATRRELCCSTSLPAPRRRSRRSGSTAAVDDALQRLVARIETPAGGGSPAATSSVVDPPTSGAVTGTSATTIVGAALVGGLVIGLMVLYARERFWTSTVRTTDDLVAAGGIDVVDPAVDEREAGKATRSVHTGADNPVGHPFAAFSTATRIDRPPRGARHRGRCPATGPVADQLARSFVDSAVDTILVRAHLPLDDATAQSTTPGLAEGCSPARRS